MLPTPAHDGVRLMLPTFFFLAAFSGWGASGLTMDLGKFFGDARLALFRVGVAAIILGPAAWQLVKIHPFELSYYNELIGGPRGAWKAGFEMTYWYDAFNTKTLRELNAKIPEGTIVDFLNDKTNPMTFTELQALGELKPSIVVGRRKVSDLPYVWLLAQDSKASAFTRLLYVMKPWYERSPAQLDGLRVATVADLVAVSRAWALWLMLDDKGQPRAPDRVPEWVDRFAPFLGRFWGRGVTKSPQLTVNKALLEWARTDPRGFVKAARRSPISLIGSKIQERHV